ncbi:hypothetical protein PUN4_10004 [Paraburkholderia unamae]|nr:hypothetical protein PUN4_10004 [Paraburkholderia unamae]
MLYGLSFREGEAGRALLLHVLIRSEGARSAMAEAQGLRGRRYRPVLMGIQTSVLQIDVDLFPAVRWASVVRA